MAKRRYPNIPPKEYKTSYLVKSITGLPYPYEHPAFSPKNMEKLIGILKIALLKKQKLITIILPLQVRWAAVFGESTKRDNLDGATRNSKKGRAAFTYSVPKLYGKLYSGGYIDISLKEFGTNMQVAARDVNEMFNLFDDNIGGYTTFLPPIY